MTEREVYVHNWIRDNTQKNAAKHSPPGKWAIRPDYGTGTIQFCLNEQDISLLLVNLQLTRPLMLAPNIKKILYVSCFEDAVGKFFFHSGPTLPISSKTFNIFDSEKELRDLVLEPGVRIRGFFLLVSPEEYAKYLDHIFGRTDSISFLEKMPALDQAVSGDVIWKCVQEMFHFQGNAFSARLFYRSKAAELIARLLEENTKPADNPAEIYHRVSIKEKEMEVQQIIFYMSAHLSEPLTVEELSARFSSSPSRLSSLFRKVTKKSLPEYRNELRIREANRLLTETTLTQKEIAARIGFSRVSNFSDFYRRMTGKAPGAIRKKTK